MTVAVVPEVRLTMPARAEGVGVVRQALAGMADALAFNAAVVADMKMAVTEACTNVVVHAYEGEEGTLEVEMLADETTLTIVVRDWGTGIQPRPHRREAPALGLGLPLIAALSDSFELRGSTNSGAEVRMTFLADRAGDPAHANPVTGVASGLPLAVMTVPVPCALREFRIRTGMSCSTAGRIVAGCRTLAPK